MLFNTISSSSSVLDSVLSESDLNKLDFSKNKKLYEKELFKIIRKKMPNEPEHKIQKAFNEKIKEIKSHQYFQLECIRLVILSQKVCGTVSVR